MFFTVAAPDATTESTPTVGSIAGGGRYDELVGSMFKFTGIKQVPCVGFSIGIERIFTIMEERAKRGGEHSVRTLQTDVLVMSAQKGLLEDRMRMCKILWEAKIKVCHEVIPFYYVMYLAH